MFNDSVFTANFLMCFVCHELRKKGEDEIASANEFFSHLKFFLLPRNDAAVLSSRWQ